MTSDPAALPAEPVPSDERTGAPLLEIDDLHVEFRARRAVALAVDGASYSVASGETLAVLGESGSGKSVTARAVMGIVPSPAGRVSAGTIRFRGEDLLRMPPERQQRIRGRHIAMVFQDALSALNPVLKVGYQITEGWRYQNGKSRAEARRRAIELMDLVAIPAAAQRVDAYPHQLSGGMRQRAMIAMALASDPELLIADEPTTALDVTVQAQIIQLLVDLQRDRGMGLILITHDMGLVAGVADRVAVMYAGRVVETAPGIDIYQRPAHPYTRALLAAIPQPQLKGRRLAVIDGAPPDMAHPLTTCPFLPRCPMARAECRVPPEPYAVGPGRTSACHRWQEVPAL